MSRKKKSGRPKLSKFEKLITKEDTEKLLDYAKKKALKSRSRKDTMLYVMIMAMLKIGLRSGEVGKLEAKDCHLDREFPIIRIAGKKRKEDEKDEVFIETKFALLLKKWIEKDKPKKFVFERDRGSGVPISRQVLWKNVKKMYQILELSPKYNLHSLRHRFGTNTYIASGRDIMATKAQLRHKQVVTTDMYVHFARMEDEKTKEMLKRMEELT